MFKLINKNFHFLFFLGILISFSCLSSDVISHRKKIFLSAPGIVYCSKVDKTVVECESSKSIKFATEKVPNSIKKINYLNDYKIQILLESEKWEFFGFRKPGKTTEYILDFWKKKNSVQNKNIVKKDKVKKKLKKVSKKRKTKKDKISLKLAGNKKPNNKEITKDFRYGSLFIWDLNPIAPEIKMPFTFKRKTPDQLIDLENRDIDSSDEEAHLQLTLNLFKKMKWGLMYKSIDLFNQKYPKSKIITLMNF